MDGRDEAGAEGSEHGLGLGHPLGTRLHTESPGQVRQGHLECSFSPSRLVSGQPRMLCVYPGWSDGPCDPSLSGQVRAAGRPRLVPGPLWPLCPCNRCL